MILQDFLIEITWLWKIISLFLFVISHYKINPANIVCVLGVWFVSQAHEVVIQT